LSIVITEEIAKTDSKSSSSTPSTTKTMDGGKKRKGSTEDEANPSLNGKDAGPSTPKRKKVAKNPLPPPETPTPALAKLLSVPYSSGDVDIMTPLPAVNRLAAPNGTNAQLVSPETHRLVGTKPLDQVSPSKKANGTTTTENILDAALAHLINTEPKLKPIIEKYPCNIFSPEGLAEVIDPFQSLASGIISQQVNTVLYICLVNSTE
jgi:DNA-3-methyladenine glycosylase II